MEKERSNARIKSRAHVGDALVHEIVIGLWDVGLYSPVHNGDFQLANGKGTLLAVRCDALVIKLFSGDPEAGGLS